MAAEFDVGRIGVFGASGSGKSSFVKQRWGKEPRVIVFDPVHEYHELGFKVFKKPSELPGLIAKNVRGFRLAFQPEGTSEKDDLDALCWQVRDAQALFKSKRIGWPLTLIVEELNLSFPNVQGSPCPGFAELCSRGRHSGVELVGVSQRIAEVSTRFRGNLSERIVFMQEGEADHKAARALLRQRTGYELPTKPLEYRRLTREGNLEEGTLGRKTANKAPRAPAKSRQRSSKAKASGS